MTARAQSVSWPAWIDREQCAWLADLLAVAIAVSIPWSTSVTAILVVAWLVVLIPTLDGDSLLAGLATPAGGLPVAVWVLAAIGILWADVSLSERIAGLKGCHKLLVIPLLIIQFRRSEHGMRVLAGFLASCTLLLAVSWLFSVWPLWDTKFPGVPVKDYIVQSSEFVICAFALTHLAFEAWQRQRRLLALGCVALTILFLANVTFVAAARTAMVTYLVLVGLLAFQRFGWRGGVGLTLAGALLAWGAWSSSSYLQNRVLAITDEVHHYEAANAITSTGLRLEFWKKSIRFIAAAPLLGHGTGSIESLFRKAAVGTRGTSAAVTSNAHNMTFQLGIQFGLLGVALLYAMWLAHFWLFTQPGFMAMVGAGLVVQNVVGSLFLAYLFDFTTGWLYVVGVGVMAGSVLREQDARKRAADGDAKSTAPAALSTAPATPS